MSKRVNRKGVNTGSKHEEYGVDIGSKDFGFVSGYRFSDTASAPESTAPSGAGC
jgi:hypothetical protein